MDTAGPFPKSQDEHTKSARYLVVGVFTVQKVKPKLPEVPVEPAYAAEEAEPEVQKSGLHRDNRAMIRNPSPLQKMRK